MLEPKQKPIESCGALRRNSLSVFRMNGYSYNKIKGEKT